MAGGSLQLREYPGEMVRPVVPEMRTGRPISENGI